MLLKTWEKCLVAGCDIQKCMSLKKQAMTCDQLPLKKLLNRNITYHRRGNKIVPMTLYESGTRSSIVPQKYSHSNAEFEEARQ